MDRGDRLLLLLLLYDLGCRGAPSFRLVLRLLLTAPAALGDRGELERRVPAPSFRLDVGDTGDRGDLDLRRPLAPPVDLGDEALDGFELFRSLPSFGDNALVFLVVVVVVVVVVC
jgi:hypothetical protein